MTHPALEYAEATLGVHSVWQEALALEASLDDTLTALDKAQDARRTLDDKITDREMDILIEERGKHTDMSEAAMTRHIKERYYKDTDLKVLKLQRNIKAGECTGHEIDADFIKNQLRNRQARMQELGGYFQYLAVCKQAEKTT